MNEAAVTGKNLPIWKLAGDLERIWKERNRMVLIAPTGSGKSTQIPQMLLDSGVVRGGKVVVLQPRRVAARTLASRVAQERNVQPGGEVGYDIRFEHCSSSGTRILYITEGVLLRWLVDDPELRGVGALLFDEFHERNLFSDVGIALAKQIQEQIRPDLQIIAMSATIEARPLAAYLGDCPIVESEGQTFPVEILHEQSSASEPIWEQAAGKVEEILKSGKSGDILIFMPGLYEIQRTIQTVESLRTTEKLMMVPLHGDLPSDQQDLAFQFPPVGTRKMVVATNVAETSVTIDGIRFVIDGGWARVARYDADRGIGTLHLEAISQASAQQRAGRAGRTAPGTCYRLWTAANHSSRPERNDPEVRRVDLAEIVLLLRSLQVKDVVGFDWLDRPEPAAVKRAEALLHQLGAFDEGTGGLSWIGKQMLELPVHPRYSRMLLEAARRNSIQPVALFAALVSGRDLLVRLPRSEKQVREEREDVLANENSDFFGLAQAFVFARNHQFDPGACRRFGIHVQTARVVELTFQQLLQIAERSPILKSIQKLVENPSDADLCKCVVSGFIDHLAVRRDQGTLECILSDGRTGVLQRESAVQNSRLLIPAEIKEITTRDGTRLTLLGLATAVKVEWLEELFPGSLQRDTEYFYDEALRKVECFQTIKFRDLVLVSEEIKEILDPKQAAHALAEGLFSKKSSLPQWNHDLEQWLARVELVRTHFPELEFPNMTREQQLACLARAFEGAVSFKEIKDRPLLPAIDSLLTSEQKAKLNELAPSHVTLQGGKISKPAKITYEVESPPEITLKLHEAIGINQHPAVCQGKQPLHVLFVGPDNRHIDSTEDILEFWEKIYPEIKGALTKRYPQVQFP